MSNAIQNVVIRTVANGYEADVTPLDWFGKGYQPSPGHVFVFTDIEQLAEWLKVQAFQFPKGGNQ